MARNDIATQVHGNLLAKALRLFVAFVLMFSLVPTVPSFAFGEEDKQGAIEQGAIDSLSIDSADDEQEAVDSQSLDYADDELEDYGGNQGSLGLTLAGVEGVKTVKESKNENVITTEVDPNALSFSIEFTGAGSRWTIDRWMPDGTADGYLKDHVYPWVKIYDADRKDVVVDHDAGNLECVSAQGAVTLSSGGQGAALDFQVAPGALQPGNDYVLLIDAKFTSPNGSSELGSGLAFEFSTKAGVGGSAEAEDEVFEQSAGYEPYQGWQGTPWYDSDDPFYNSSGGAAHRACYPGWSLTTPLSKGVTAYENGAVTTGNDVTIVTDTNATRRNSAGIGRLDTAHALYDQPDYYKNVILPSVSTDAPIQFNFNYVGAGGVSTSYVFDGHGGMAIYDTDDQSLLSNSDHIVWEASASDATISSTASNWWKNVTITVPEGKLDANRTYYLVIKNGTAGQWARVWADIVFEFNTFTDAKWTWSGDESSVAYGNAQGDGNVKVGILRPEAENIRIDLTKLDECFYNFLPEEVALDEGSTSFRIYGDGSGANWENSLLWWFSNADILVYDKDPMASGTFSVSDLDPAASLTKGNLTYRCPDPEYMQTWTAWDEGGRVGSEPATAAFGYTGADVVLSDLKPGRDYYLVVPQGYKFQNAQGPLIEPIVIAFSTESDAAASWDISAAQDGSLKASVVENDDATMRLEVAGSGAMMDFASKDAVPWASYASTIVSVSLPAGLTTIGDHAFEGCTAMIAVDATACEGLTKIGPGAFCFTPGSMTQGSTVYLANDAVASLLMGGQSSLTTYTNENIIQQNTCAAVANGGRLPADATFALKVLASLERDDATFTGWYTTAAGTGSPTSWSNFSGAARKIYAGWEALAAPGGDEWQIGSPVASAVTATLSDDGTLRIEGTGDLVAFASYNDQPWADVRDSIVSVEFGDGLTPTDLNRYFRGCTSLVSVTGMPDSVTSLQSAFWGCTALVAVPDLPASLVDMTSTFRECTALTSAGVIPDGVTVMQHTFDGCTALTSIASLPSNARDICYVLANSGIVEMPDIPTNVTAASYAFYKCSQLHTIKPLPASLLTQAPGLAQAMGIFWNCPNVTEIPTGFMFPANFTDFGNMFRIDEDTGTEHPLRTYVEDSADSSVLNYDWASDGRVLLVRKQIEIATAQQLKDFADAVNAGDGYAAITATLTADIDLSALDGDWTPIAPDRSTSFEGKFDGAGHTVSGFTVASNSYYAGLFGNVDGGTVKNVRVSDAEVQGTGFVGGVVGQATNGATVEGCSSSVSVEGAYAYASGGVVGYAYTRAVIIDCVNSGSVKGAQNVGGVIGSAYGASTITRCSNTGDVTYTGTAGDNNIGGVVGWGYGNADPDHTLITLCYNRGAVLNEGGAANAGGVVGYLMNDASCADCFNLGKVSTPSQQYEHGSYTGGVAGRMYSASLSTSYNAGSVSGVGTLGGALGGIVNASDAAKATNLYYLNTCVDQQASASYGTSLNADQLKLLTNLVGFSDAVWHQNLPNGYPTFDDDDGTIEDEDEEGDLEAFAVYSADDKSLTFYKATDKPLPNATYNGKKATYVYEGIETTSYSLDDMVVPGWALGDGRVAGDVASVEFADTLSPVSISGWFMDMTKISTIDLTKLDTSQVVDMSSLFSACYKLVSIDGLTGFDTSNCKNFEDMFSRCESLTSLDLSSFDTRNATNMKNMFAERNSNAAESYQWKMNSLQEVTLGANFSFTGSGVTSCTLPTPSADYIEGADGNWYDTTTNQGYAPADVPNRTAATYTAIAPVVSTDWDVSAAKDGSIIATVELNEGNATYTLVFTGKGRMESYTSAITAPWYADYGTLITAATFSDGIENIGEYALALPKLVTVKGGNAIAEIGNNAFQGAFELVAADLSACTLTKVYSNSLGGQQSFLKTLRTFYVKDNESATAMKSHTAGTTSKTAVAVMNGGAFDEGTTFVSGEVATPSQEGYTFVAWTSDDALMWPLSAPYWQAMSTGPVYAKFSQNAVVVEPTPYAGYQGLDQRVTLLDPDALPRQVVNPNVLFYGENEEHFDNRFKEDVTFDVDERTMFAFTMARGSNANGGNGAYQLSFCLPFVSIIDADGNTVASYDDGSGALRNFGIVFDGVEGKTTGYTITAVRIGVEPGVLQPGSYTLRFGAGFGANNGISFLGKNVDFAFEVVKEEKYGLHYSFDSATHTATVDGFTSAVNDPTSVEIPATAVGDDGETYTVKAIDSAWLSGSTNKVSSVTVPATVTSIGTGAFANQAALEWVKVLADSESTMPEWGAGAFSGSRDCILYGYLNSSCQTLANANANVTFYPLDDGIYVNGDLVMSDDTIQLTAAKPEAVFAIMKDGDAVTDMYSGFITNTNVVGHPSTARYEWQTLTGKANGAAQLHIRDASTGTPLATINVIATGFAADASTDLSVITGVYQGNGATIAAMDMGEVLTCSFDETIDYFDNYLVDGVAIEGAEIRLEMGGPGSSWSYTHAGWNWPQFVANVNSNIRLVNAEGATIATPGNGLTLTKLVSSPSTIAFVIDGGVMKAGDAYTLIADKGLTSHNVASSLMEAVHWTFTAVKADLSLKDTYSVSAADPASAIWTGLPIEPTVTVEATTPATSIWNDETHQHDTTEAGSRSLASGTDYVLTYEDNVGDKSLTTTAYVVVTGTGNYTGEVRVPFSITPAPADRDELTATIAEAQAYKDSLTASDDGSELAAGVTWATPANLALLQEAIDNAQAVMNRIGATQAEVDVAVDALEAAVSAFKDSSENTAAPSKALLLSTITEARDSVTKLAVAPDSMNLPHGTKWITQAESEAVEHALAAAQAVVDDAAASQKQIDLACQNLSDIWTAVTVKVTVVNGTDLSETIAAADTLLQTVKVSDESIEEGAGSDIFATERWVLQETADALTKRVTDARNMLAAVDRTQVSVNEALDTLKNAMIEFEGAAHAGRLIDARELSATMATVRDQIENSYNDVVIAESESGLQPGTRWIARAKRESLDAALTNAEFVYERSNGYVIRTEDMYQAMMRTAAHLSAVDGASEDEGVEGPSGDGETNEEESFVPSQSIVDGATARITTAWEDYKASIRTVAQPDNGLGPDSPNDSGNNGGSDGDGSFGIDGGWTQGQQQPVLQLSVPLVHTGTASGNDQLQTSLVATGDVNGNAAAMATAIATLMLLVALCIRRTDVTISKAQHRR